MLKRMVIFFILLSSLAGCVTVPEKGPRFTGIAETRPGFSLLYIYRPYNYVGHIVWPEIFLNEVKTVGLVDESYAFVYIRPGQYLIRTEKCHPLSGMGNIPGEIFIEPNKIYFLFFDRKYELNPLSDMPIQIYARWTLVDKDEAVSEMRRLKYVKPYVETVGAD